MRIFIGIKLDTIAHNNIGKFLLPLKKVTTPIRWTKPQNVHITLKFIGDMNNDIFKRMIQQLDSNSFKAKLTDNPMDIRLTGCGKFGRQENLNIFWIGIESNPQLQQLYQHIEDTLDKIDIPKEDRPFKPHITVGRNKKHFNFNSFYQMMAKHEDQQIASINTSHFQVFKSDLQSNGPTYKILKEIPLTNGQA
jgi:RNA 2',3'-cyclic 3'-phosphodiesterase